MVNTRMDGRVDNLEGRISGVEQGIAHLDTEFTSLKELMVEALSEMKNNKRSEERGKMVIENSASTSQGRNGGMDLTLGEAERDPMKYKRLELPMFSGEDPLGWVFRVERFFRMSNISAEEKLDAATVALEGKALSWFLWVESRRPWRNWTDLKRELITRFHPSLSGDQYEKLMVLKQSTTVAEYREQFEAISVTISGAEDDVLIRAFKNGLKEEVRAELRLQKGLTMFELMEMAQRVEERNTIVDRIRESKWVKGIRTFSHWAGSKPAQSYTKLASNNDANKSSIPVTVGRNPETKGGTESRNGSTGMGTNASTTNYRYKRLTDEEAAKKRELGLCYRCDEKFGPNHRCKKKRTPGPYFISIA